MPDENHVVSSHLLRMSAEEMACTYHQQRTMVLRQDLIFDYVRIPLLALSPGAVTASQPLASGKSSGRFPTIAGAPATRLSNAARQTTVSAITVAPVKAPGGAPLPH